MGGRSGEQILTSVDRVIAGSANAPMVTDVLDHAGMGSPASPIRIHIPWSIGTDRPENHETAGVDLKRVRRGLYQLQTKR